MQADCSNWPGYRQKGILKMVRFSPIALCALLIGLPHTGTALTVPTPDSPLSSAQAELKNAEGQATGTVRLTQRGEDIAVSVSVLGLTPGMHGTHVHMTGACDAPDFMGAGGHWNPAATQHGLQNPQGHHAGDLPNMEVKADGKGALEFTIANAQLAGAEHALLDADGAAIVIHAGPDDMVSDPAGNSGGRIACGVVRPD